MSVLMMCVVGVQVIVVHWPVIMTVIVPFRQVKPDSRSHQNRREEKSNTQRIAQEQDRYRSADKRGGREIGTGAGCPNVPQCQHKERQADSIAEESDQADLQQHSTVGQL